MILIKIPFFFIISVLFISSCTTRFTSERETTDSIPSITSFEDSVHEENTESKGEFSTKRTSVVYAINQSYSWVDSVFATLSSEEKIAQLIMVQAFSNMGKKHEDSLFRAVTKHKVGGMVVSLGGPVRQAKLMNNLQKASKVPLLLAMDAEWGLGMRLDSTISYPFQMTLGAIQDDSIIYQMGKEIAAHFKRIGMHVNFAPVVDVNNNPNNPIINFRSFGENKYKVADKGLAYMRGMQNNGIIAVAKHFPGHGDTDVDSHLALPLLNFTRARLDSLEMYPFKELINNDVGGIMVAHLAIPELDPTPNLPSTLSKPIVTEILKNDLQFQGLIFTDAMNMKGVTKFFPKGAGDVQAVIAGNDILEITENAAVAISKIKQALEKEEIQQEEIDARCKKVLAAKYWAGLHNYQPVEINNLVEDLNTAENNTTLRYMAKAALTLLINKNNVLPIKSSENLKIATLAVGVGEAGVFQKVLEQEGISNHHFFLSKNGTSKNINVLKEKLKNYDLVLVGIYGPRKRPNTKLGYSREVTEYTKELTLHEKNVFTIFANPYTLTQFGAWDNTAGLLLNYELNPFAEEAAANFITGKAGASGTLPVSIGSKFNSGDGIIIRE
jgi:beta-glucosidase-like glycosyl hydrolase